jgi:hypothetical protein
MDSRQAKEILELYRPGVDDEDQQFAEALAQTESDPDLRRWFEEHCALYAAIRGKMKDIPVPVDLRSRIAVGRKSASEVAWWRSPWALAAAAIITICVSIYSLLTQLTPQMPAPAVARNDFPGFRQRMVDFALSGYKVNIHSETLDELRQEFARKDWPSQYIVPAGLAKLHVEGGYLMKWNGHKVSMLCLNAPGDHDVWLYVIARDALPKDSPCHAEPELAQIGKLITASWSDNTNTYLLATEGDAAFVRPLLPAQPST